MMAGNKVFSEFLFFQILRNYERLNPGKHTHKARHKFYLSDSTIKEKKFPISRQQNKCVYAAYSKIGKFMYSRPPLKCLRPKSG